MGKEPRGFSLVELSLAVLVILIIAAIAIPNYVRLRMAANQASAVSSLHTVNAAEATYSSTFGGTFSLDLASLGPPATGANATSSAAGLIDSVLAAGAKGGYSFTYSPGVADSSGNITTYALAAAPLAASTGLNQYQSDQSGAVTRVNAAGNTSASTPSAESSPTACSESGNAVTVASTLHPPVGSVIQWSGADPPAYNSGAGGWVVTDSSSGSFSFQNPTAGLGPCTEMGEVVLP
jgi:prepilin-type N-terminal cleavage/methylation domain-containing protein